MTISHEYSTRLRRKSNSIRFVIQEKTKSGYRLFYTHAKVMSQSAVAGFKVNWKVGNEERKVLQDFVYNNDIDSIVDAQIDRHYSKEADG